MKYFFALLLVVVLTSCDSQPDDPIIGAWCSYQFCMTFSDDDVLIHGTREDDEKHSYEVFQDNSIRIPGRGWDIAYEFSVDNAILRLTVEGFNETLSFYRYEGKFSIKGNWCTANECLMVEDSVMTLSSTNGGESIYSINYTLAGPYTFMSDESSSPYRYIVSENGKYLRLLAGSDDLKFEKQ